MQAQAKMHQENETNDLKKKLEGLFVQIKNISIFISFQAGNIKKLNRLQPIF